MNWFARWRRGDTTPAGTPRWIVLDVETTGLDTVHDHLLAIAAVAIVFERGRPRNDLRDSFEAVLQHESPSTDKDNILLHGIGVAAQRAGAPPARVLADFARWAGAAPRLAFHADFDRAMIERAELAALGRRTSAQWLDLAPVAAALHPLAGGETLDDWLDHFAIPCTPRHQAAADTLATAELLLRLWPQAERQRSASLAGLSALARHQRWLGG